MQMPPIWRVTWSSLGACFDAGLPMVDFGCGNGAQSRLLARHFERVVGIDFSPPAVERARAADNPPNVVYRVLDARDPADAQRLHAKLGDVNVYIRVVRQAMPPADRPRAVESLARLVGEAGTAFAKELTPEAAPYFAKLMERPRFDAWHGAHAAPDPSRIDNPAGAPEPVF
jgi:SAM-dependent methyltransferase